MPRILLLFKMILELQLGTAFLHTLRELLQMFPKVKDMYMFLIGISFIFRKKQITQ